MGQSNCLDCVIFRKILSLSQTLKLHVYRRHPFQPQRKYKATWECRLEETTRKRPFCVNSSVSLHNPIHPIWETWTNYLTFAYKLHIFGFCGMVPCVILGQFLNLSKSLLPGLQSRLVLVMQDGVRLNELKFVKGFLIFRYYVEDRLEKSI